MGKKRALNIRKRALNIQRGGASAPLALPQIRHYSLLSNYLARRIYFSNGSNDVWNYDGYDKIKQYGFPIHDVVDGFSRKILWLKIVK